MSFHNKQRRKKRIRDRVRARRISCLTHFTRMDNVASIARNGLLSRDRMDRLKGSGFSYVHTDEKRLDGMPDHISTSVSFPNYKMFYKCRQEFSPDNWVVILIRKEALWKLDCKFFFNNAAGSEIQSPSHKRWSRVKAFDRMFEREKRNVNIPPCYPTNPQAEVMIKDEIPKEYIEKVAVETPSAGGLINISYPVEVIVKLFRWRRDYAQWKGGNH